MDFEYQPERVFLCSAMNDGMFYVLLPENFTVHVLQIYKNSIMEVSKQFQTSKDPIFIALNGFLAVVPQWKGKADVYDLESREPLTFISSVQLPEIEPEVQVGNLFMSKGGRIDMLQLMDDVQHEGISCESMWSLVQKPYNTRQIISAIKHLIKVQTPLSDLFSFLKECQRLQTEKPPSTHSAPSRHDFLTDIGPFCQNIDTLNAQYVTAISMELLVIFGGTDEASNSFSLGIWRLLRQRSDIHVAIAFIGARILGDSVPLALTLLEENHTELKQLGFDLLFRMKRHDLIIHGLISGGAIMDGIRSVRLFNLIHQLEPKVLFEAALQSSEKGGDVFYHTFRFLEQRNGFLYKSVSFRENDQCEKYVEQFQKMYGK